MSRRDLKEAAFLANIDLPRMKLVLHTWGNASQIDREAGEIAIKPSGISYRDMRLDDIVVVDIEGHVIEGSLNPSSDLMTHLALYKALERIGGIVHTHSTYATIWAQAKREIPCIGTTHADTFYGAVPVTRDLTDDEIMTEYELNTGRVIAERFASLDALHIPGALVAGHGPFTWGPTAEVAVYNATVLEEIARMALHTNALSPTGLSPVSQTLLDKHFLRKHGENAYYGQKT